MTESGASTGQTNTAGDVDTAFVRRYVELWNEADPRQRRHEVEELWAPGGTNFTASITATGHEEIDARVTRSYEAYVGTGQYRFRSTVPPAGHHDAVLVRWEMVRVTDGEVASVGFEFLQLDDEGRIASDHQFVLG